MPDRDVFLLGFIVDGDVRWLVNLSWLQNQHLQHRERKSLSPTGHRGFLECTWKRVLYREAQAVGGSLRGLHDNVHPEVEFLPQGGMFHRLLLKPLDQVQVLHNRPQIPERDERPETNLFLHYLDVGCEENLLFFFFAYQSGGLSLKSFSAAWVAFGMSLASMLTVKNWPTSQ